VYTFIREGAAAREVGPLGSVLVGYYNPAINGVYNLVVVFDKKDVPEGIKIGAREIPETFMEPANEVRIVIPMQNHLRAEGDYFVHLAHTAIPESWSERIETHKYVEYLE
jgi:hypothetical protein